MQQTQTRSSQSGSQSSSSQHQNVSNIGTFNKAIAASDMNGDAVALIATGNIEGASPGFQAVYENGNTAWLPQNQVQITDPEVLSKTSSAYQTGSSSGLRNLRSSGSSSSNSGS